MKFSKETRIPPMCAVAHAVHYSMPGTKIIFTFVEFSCLALCLQTAPFGLLFAASARFASAGA